jgi:hypothetical protein
MPARLCDSFSATGAWSHCQHSLSQLLWLEAVRCEELLQGRNMSPADHLFALAMGSSSDEATHHGVHASRTVAL